MNDKIFSQNMKSIVLERAFWVSGEKPRDKRV
jgi:hypothetical protein